MEAMNDSTTAPSDASADIELILNRLAELVAELDGLCRTLQSEPQSDRANAVIRASAQKYVTRRLQPETTFMADTLATIEIVDARPKGGGSPAAERIVGAVLPGL
ncbi:MAG TPA: hypothetical protein VLD18_01565, partial [Verrucomicrobiae bacterium]|nr:hypothetical protein [Verrucomicrobiae bacterium]